MRRTRDADPLRDDTAERAVLGAVLLHPSFLPGVAAALVPGDFAKDAHQVVAGAIRSLHDANTPTEMLAVRDVLRRRGELDRVGDGYLMALPDALLIRDPLTLQRTIERLQALARARRAAYELQNAERLLTQHPDQAGAILSSLTDRLQAVQPPSTPLLASAIRSASELGQLTPEYPEWIAKPLAVRGGITLLTSTPKLGKSSLAVALTHAVTCSGRFLGTPTVQTPALYCTEERPATFRQHLARVGALLSSDLFVLSRWELAGLDWAAIVQAIGREAASRNAGLIIVDTFMVWAALEGDAENNSGAMLTALEPLQRLAQHHAILIVHHDRKALGEVGESARGSNALVGAVDLVFTLRRAPGAGPRSLRVLHSLSRLDDVPESLVIDRRILPDGHLGYIALGDAVAVSLMEAKTALLADLPTTEAEAVSLQDFLASHPNLSRGNVRRALAELADQPRPLGSGVWPQTIGKVGTGKRGDAIRYFKADDLVSDQTHVPILATNHSEEEAGHDATRI